MSLKGTIVQLAYRQLKRTYLKKNVLYKNNLRKIFYHLQKPLLLFYYTQSEEVTKIGYKHKFYFSPNFSCKMMMNGSIIYNLLRMKSWGLDMFYPTMINFQAFNRFKLYILKKVFVIYICILEISKVFYQNPCPFLGVYSLNLAANSSSSCMYWKELSSNGQTHKKTNFVDILVRIKSKHLF